MPNKGNLFAQTQDLARNVVAMQAEMDSLSNSHTPPDTIIELITERGKNLTKMQDELQVGDGNQYATVLVTGSFEFQSTQSGCHSV